MPKPSPQHQLAWLIGDPVRFGRGVLGVDVTPAQASILTALTTERRLAIRACHASGKTFAAAIAVIWWIVAHPDGIAITTAPTWTQVERVLWAEIHRLLGAARWRLQFGSQNRTELRVGPKNFALGLSTNEGVRFQGFHGANVLIVLDEAPGVQTDIWEAIEGIRAGGNVRVLAIGNPTAASGPFYDAFSRDRANWWTRSISAFDTPNLVGHDLASVLAMDPDALDVAPRPYLVTRRWVREKHGEWGPQHPLWQARVLGDFPIHADDALLSLAWIEAATTRLLAWRPRDRVEIGIDVAGPGEDETVVCVRQGPCIRAMQAFADSDPRGAVLAYLRQWRGDAPLVKVDSVGIGYNFALHIRDQGYEVEEVNVGVAARDTEQFVNAKAEFCWGLRQRFEAGDIAGELDEATVAQLASIRYEHTPRGQLKIESKEDARKRGVRSPDRAEAVMLAFATSSAPILAPVSLEQPSYWRAV